MRPFFAVHFSLEKSGLDSGDLKKLNSSVLCCVQAFTIQAVMPSAIAKNNFVAGFVPILMHFIKDVSL